MTHDEMIEAVALALVNRDQERFDLPRIETIADFRCQEDAAEYLANARAAIRVIAPAVERVLRERDQAVEVLRLFVRLMNDPDYDLGELCEEFCTRAETILASIEGTEHE